MTNLTLINLTISDCLKFYDNEHEGHSVRNSKYLETLILFNCYNVYLHQILLENDITNNGGRLLAINMLGNGTLSWITANELKIYYYDYDAVALDVPISFNHTLTIDHYTALYYSHIGERPTHDVFYEPTAYYPYKDGSDDYNYDKYHDINDHSYPNGFHEFNFNDIDTIPALSIVLAQNLYGINIKVIHTPLVFLQYFEALTVIIDNFAIHKNSILFEYCTFAGNFYTARNNKIASLINIRLLVSIANSDKIQFAGSSVVVFNNCLFHQNYYEGSLISVTWEYKHCGQNNKTIYQLHIKEQIIFSHCSFENNIFIYILQLESSTKVGIIAHFVNTQFKYLNVSEKGFNDIIGRPAIYALNVSILMEGPIASPQLMSQKACFILVQKL